MPPQGSQTGGGTGTVRSVDGAPATGSAVVVTGGPITGTGVLHFDNNGTGVNQVLATTRGAGSAPYVMRSRTIGIGDLAVIDSGNGPYGNFVIPGVQGGILGAPPNTSGYVPVSVAGSPGSVAWQLQASGNLPNVPAGEVLGGPATGAPAQAASVSITPAYLTGAAVSTSQPGIVPQLPGNSALFFNGNGSYSTPAGGNSPLGPRTRDIRAFAANPAAPTAVEMQAAHDALVSSVVDGANNSNIGTVYVPSGFWDVGGSPIFFDCANVRLYAEPGGVLTMTGLNGWPISWGLKRTAKWTANSAFNPLPYNNTQVYPGPNQYVTLGGNEYISVFNGSFVGHTPPNATYWSLVGAAPSTTSPAFFAPDHRMDLFGILDATVAPVGNVAFGISSRSPSSPAPSTVADHTLMVIAAPPAVAGGSTGVDYWRSQQKFTLELAFEKPAQNGTNMRLCGIGVDPTFPVTWSLTSDSSQFTFRFMTIEGAYGGPGQGPGAARTLHFGNATKTGVIKIWLQVDFTANDGSGKCALTAAQNTGGGSSMVQQTVTRDFGTQKTAQFMAISIPGSGGTFILTGVRPDTNVQTSQTLNYSPTIPQLQTALDAIYGSGNTTGAFTSAGLVEWTMAGSLVNLNTPSPSVNVANITGAGTPVYLHEPGFAAGMNLHFNPNFLYPFWMFGSLQWSGPFSGNSCVCNLYGFQISNGWVYSDQGAGNPERRGPEAGFPSGGQTNTDALRYQNAAGANTIVFLTTGQHPHDATLNSDKLVKFQGGSAAGGGFGILGWMQVVANDGVGNQADAFLGGVGGWFCEGLETRSCSSVGGVGAIIVSSIGNTWRRCRFYGGFWGVFISGGFNDAFEDVMGENASDANIVVYNKIGKMTGCFGPIGFGECFVRLGSAEWDMSEVRVLLGGPNQFGHTSSECVRIHGDGGNNIVVERYLLGAWESDYELTAGPPFLHLSLSIYTPQVVVEDTLQWGLGGGPLANNSFLAIVDGANFGRTGTLVMRRCATGLSTAGQIVACDGPGCAILVEDSTDTLTTENFRFIGPTPTPAAPLNAIRRSRQTALPTAGKFLAGTQWIELVNPAASSPAIYVCTTSGDFAGTPPHFAVLASTGP